MITLILHLYDNTDNPKRSQQNATEPIYLDRNEHVIELFCGEGMQSIKWLTLAAAGRLKHLRKNTMTGRVRFREAYLGIDSQFLMPSSIDTKRRDAKDDTNLLPLKNPYAKIKDVFEDQDHIWINFDERGGTVTKWKTTAYHLDKELVIPKPQSPKKEESPLKMEAKGPTHLSIILPRVYECDAKDYYDTQILLDKALLADWEQHMKKPKWLERQDKTVFETIRQFYPALISIFRYYSALGGGQLFKTNKNEFNSFLKRCNIKQRRE